MCGCYHMSPTGDVARNPGMCPDWELNLQLFGSQAVLNPLSHTSQGPNLFKINVTVGIPSSLAIFPTCLCLLSLVILNSLKQNYNPRVLDIDLIDMHHNK